MQITLSFKSATPFQYLLQTTLNTTIYKTPIRNPTEKCITETLPSTPTFQLLIQEFDAIEIRVLQAENGQIQVKNVHISYQISFSAALREAVISFKSVSQTMLQKVKIVFQQFSIYCESDKKFEIPAGNFEIQLFLVTRFGEFLVQKGVFLNENFVYFGAKLERIELSGAQNAFLGLLGEKLSKKKNQMLQDNFSNLQKNALECDKNLMKLLQKRNQLEFDQFSFIFTCFSTGDLQAKTSDLLIISEEKLLRNDITPTITASGSYHLENQHFQLLGANHTCHLPQHDFYVQKSDLSDGNRIDALNLREMLRIGQNKAVLQLQQENIEITLKSAHQHQQLTESSILQFQQKIRQKQVNTKIVQTDTFLQFNSQSKQINCQADWTEGFSDVVDTEIEIPLPVATCEEFRKSEFQHTKLLKLENLGVENKKMLKSSVSQRTVSKIPQVVKRASSQMKVPQILSSEENEIAKQINEAKRRIKALQGFQRK